LPGSTKRLEAMKVNKRWMVLALALLVLASLTGRAQAQLLMVTGEYRVTDVDRSGQRLGVALRADDPDRRQNWVNVRSDTKIVRRIWLKGGAFRDEVMTWNGFFDHVRKGTQLKVHGGRGRDGTITAKKIWL